MSYMCEALTTTIFSLNQLLLHSYYSKVAGDHVLIISLKSNVLSLSVPSSR